MTTPRAGTKPPAGLRAAPPPRPGERRDFGPAIRLRPSKAATAPPPVPAAATPLQQRQAQAAVVRVDPRRQVVKEFRPDPAKPGGALVRGGRVRDPLLKMREAGTISKWQWDAVERFRDDVAVAGGARPDLFLKSSSAPPGGRAWPTDQQIDALRRVNGIMAGFGLVQRRLLTWTALEHRTLRSFARELRMRNETAGDMLQFVLNSLANSVPAKGDR